MKAIILIILLGASLAAGATLYSVVDLGSLGGNSSVAYHINNAGVVVGWSRTATNDNHAFTAATTGSPHDVNQAAASNSFAYGNNGSGQIVGTSYIDGQSHGTLWSGSGLTDLGAGTAAISINASGQIAGGNGRAFVYGNGQFTDIGTLSGGHWSQAYGINDSGTAVGYGATANGFRAFTWSSTSGLSALGTLGGNSSYAMAVNNLGQVAGHSVAGDGYDHAFISNNGILTDIGSTGSNSFAYGINNDGSVVGYNAAGAFLYSNGTVVNLNSMLSPNSGWDLQQAYGINDGGKIVGTGMFHGQSRAFELDPFILGVAAPVSVPEPGSVVLLGLGLILLVACGRHWRPAGRPDKLKHVLR